MHLYLQNQLVKDEVPYPFSQVFFSMVLYAYKYSQNQ